MKINFERETCRKVFNCDVRKIGIDEKKMRSFFEKDIVCPRCGKRSTDGVLLTKPGQSPMTEATL